MGVTGASLGVGGGEDGVDQDESSDDLSAESGAFVVAVGEFVGSSAVPHVVAFVESLDQTHTTNGS